MTTAAEFLNNSMYIMNSGSLRVEASAPEAQWARIRCASRYRPLLEQYSTYDLAYKTMPEVYVVDTGVNFAHTEFAGLETENFYSFNADFNDNVGRGTAVASLIAGKNLGIARNCKLISVKISDSNTKATIEDIAQALDAIIARASAQDITRIVNIGWELPKTEIIDAKIQALLDLGVTVIASSGDSGIDTATCSPQNLADVLVVGSADKYDIPSGYNSIAPSGAGIITNYGSSLAIFAPGEEVVVASGANEYVVDSSSAYSTALVTGIASEIAAIHEGLLPHVAIKQSILETATTNVLLFDVDSDGVQRFAEEQNRLAYIFVADPNANYKTKDMSMYLGVHSNDQPLVINISSAISAASVSNFYGEAPRYSIEWTDRETEALYSEFVTVDSETGKITILEPTVALPADMKLKMASFIGVATVGEVRMTSPTFFFFHCNSAYQETQQTDITAALTETNSVSHFNSWYYYLK